LLTADYLRESTRAGRLRLLLVLLDARRAVTDIDASFIQFLQATGVRYMCVMTVPPPLFGAALVVRLLGTADLSIAESGSVAAVRGADSD
jgi:hypothetical protein